MSQSKQPAEPNSVTVSNAPDYRNNYANSVQVRMSVWDFFMVFGAMHRDASERMQVENFQGIYLSPQQAKALLNILSHNVVQYEQTFGAIALEPQFVAASGPVC